MQLYWITDISQVTGTVLGSLRPQILRQYSQCQQTMRVNEFLNVHYILCVAKYVITLHKQVTANLLCIYFLILVVIMSVTVSTSNNEAHIKVT